MGKIGKHVLKHYAEYECPRQVLLDLGADDPRWLSPLRELVRGEARRVGGLNLADLGKAYERSVYAVLQRNRAARFAEVVDPDASLGSSKLTAATLRSYGDELRAEGASPVLFLLEHEWPTPSDFVRFLFDLPGDAPMPVLQAGGDLRPDIHVLRRPSARDATEVLPDGSLRKLSPDETARRVAIELVDIKHTHEQGVGGTHFIELHYYALALSAFLREHGLTDTFFVPVDGHGILPRRDVPQLADLRVAEPASLAVPLSWRDTAHIFEAARAQVRALHRAAPVAIESVDARIQRACGHCTYMADCTASLKRGPDPRDWDVALLPFMRQGIAEQLRARGLHTVGEVSEKIRALPPGATPTPVDAEVPSLELKARALVAGTVLPATPENTAGERMVSIALPRFTDAELFFDLETDPTNEVVFAMGLLWCVGTAPAAPHRAAHDAWWGFWRQHLDAVRRHRADGHKSALPVDTAALKALIDARVLADTRLDDDGIRHALEEVAASLVALDTTSGSTLEITDQLLALARRDGTFDDTPEENPADARPFQVQWRFTYANGGSRTGGGYRDGERVLAERLVGSVVHVVRLSLAYERFVGNPVDGTNAKGEPYTWFQRPGFAVFHWSREQVGHIEDLVERHLTHFVTGKHRAHFLELLDWVAPSGSGVTNALQHLKVFDLREFVETSLGHPEIINVTWHGVDARLDPAHARTYSTRYWAPHFNYMDFAVWHDYLDEPDANEQTEKYKKLTEQIARKLWALRRILRGARRSVGEGIARSHWRPLPSAKMSERVLPPGSHPLATMWVLFSRLSAAVQSLDGQYVRATFPLQSIAKLAAAEATKVTWDAATRRFAFEVRGLSSNVNLKDGDHALLVPESLRDSYLAERCAVVLEKMAWDAAQGGYFVEAVYGGRSSDGHPCFAAPPEPGARWFLYPSPSDSWTDRLTRALERKNLGKSWLGYHLAAKWRIGTEAELQKPASLSVGAPEVYLYAPTVLPAESPSPLPLSTTQHPPPDPSQTEAIRASLANTVSCIQGPPGTGKSQTIAALIDEFLVRRKGKPARVLVTAFSYPALRVVLDKVREARDAAGQPTEAAATRLVWMRAEGRDPIPDAPGLAHVTDVVVGSGGSASIDGARLNRRDPKQKRLDLPLGDRFVAFANAHSLVKLGQPSGSKGFEYELLSNGFGFDLIIIDEASQVPVSQLPASLALVRPHPLPLRFARGPIADGAWPLRDIRPAETLALDGAVDADALTKVVIVGDDNQLPPVQPIEPPEKLRTILDSAFGYFVKGHRVPFRQLQRNYRSKPTIVAYTSRLDIYSAGLQAFRAEVPFPPLPPPPAGTPPWVRRVLDDGVDVSALIHETLHETAVSALEAHLAAELCLAFFDQLGVRDEADERRFWAEEIGIVAPHNAQGRLVTRAIYAALTKPEARRTALDDEALMRCLRATIYSVEKFQGSDRTFILGTVALSSRDQLAAEEAFIYDLNRFNVLTSRAKQKMVLLCSRAFLDYIPRDREVFKHAARVRDFAFGFCDRAESVRAAGPDGSEIALTWRYRV